MAATVSPAAQKNNRARPPRRAKIGSPASAAMIRPTTAGHRMKFETPDKRNGAGIVIRIVTAETIQRARTLPARRMDRRAINTNSSGIASSAAQTGNHPPTRVSDPASNKPYGSSQAIKKPGSNERAVSGSEGASETMS